MRYVYITLMLLFSTLAYADKTLTREEIAAELTQKAIEVDLKISFKVDPNDDTTLVLYRATTLKPSELAGDWNIYLLSVGSDIEALKKDGFNKARIYTSKSDGVSDYVLKIL